MNDPIYFEIFFLWLMLNLIFDFVKNCFLNIQVLCIH